MNELSKKEEKIIENKIKKMDNEIYEDKEKNKNKGIQYFKNLPRNYSIRQCKNTPISELMSSYKISKKHIKILLLGLDNAGKSTLIYYLDHNDEAYRHGYPTGGTVHIVNFIADDINLEFYDYGGQGVFRDDWKYYCPNPDFIIFIIDSDDEGRIEEVNYYFQSILKEEKLKKIPILIFGNKADLPNYYLGPDEIIEKLNMNDIEDRDWSFYACSALKGTGVRDGFRWIFEKLSDNY